MSYELIKGSAHSLPTVADRSVHCLVTSPPYFGLRAYDGEQAIEWPTVEYSPMPGLAPIRIQGCEPGCGHEWGKHLPGHHPGQCAQTKTGNREAAAIGQNTPAGQYCIHCGGWRGGLGLEPDISAYIGHLILCLREWERILRDDGLAFVNLGDSFINKDLQLIPHAFAFAAKADGWLCRQAMPWLKRNGLPESATDRPSQTIESVFMLSKSERYFFDMEAVKVTCGDNTHGGGNSYGGPKWSEARIHVSEKSTLGGRDREAKGSGRHLRSSDLFFKTWQGLLSNDEGDPLAVVINPQPFSAAHFAVFPPLLPEVCILAGTSAQGACPECGAPWKRITEKEMPPLRKVATNGPAGDHGLLGGNRFDEPIKVTTTGWAPSCSCGRDDVAPCVVMDPFSGSGTTGAVAAKLGRSYIGVDLASEYLEQITGERMGDGVQMEMSW